MKRVFNNTQGKVGALRGYRTWKVGTYVNGRGQIAPFIKHTGFWRAAKRKAIAEYPNATQFYVSCK